MVQRSHAVASYTGAAESLPAEYLLGSVLYFTISQLSISLADAREDLEYLGLPLDMLRKRLRPIDAFKKATKELEKKFGTDEGIRSVFMVRPAGEDEFSVHRFVVLERLKIEQGKKRRLAYEVVAEVRFHRGNLLHYAKGDSEYVGHGIEVIPKNVPGLVYTETEEEWLEESLRTLPERYRYWCTHLDEHAIRTYVREFIVNLGGTCLKESGSFYFLAQRHTKAVDALKHWLRSLGQEFNSFPLLDIAEQRDILRQAVAQETREEIERLQGQIAPALKGERKMRPATAQELLAKSGELLERAKEYEQLLDRDLEDTRDLLDVFKRQVWALAYNTEPDDEDEDQE